MAIYLSLYKSTKNLKSAYELITSSAAYNNLAGCGLDSLVLTRETTAKIAVLHKP